VKDDLPHDLSTSPKIKKILAAEKKQEQIPHQAILLTSTLILIAFNNNIISKSHKVLYF
jgi:hypothetical protein